MLYKLQASAQSRRVNYQFHQNENTRLPEMNFKIKQRVWLHIYRVNNMLGICSQFKIYSRQIFNKFSFFFKNSIFLHMTEIIQIILLFS